MYLAEPVRIARDVGKRRRYWRDWMPWNWSTRRWLLVLLISMIMSPFAMRWYWLSQIPDVPCPFDIEEFLAQQNITPEDDSLVLYRKAFAIMGATRPQFDALDSNRKSIRAAIIEAMEIPDAPWDPRIKSWLREHQPAFDLFRQASAKAHAKVPSLRTADGNISLNDLSEMRLLSFHAHLVGIDCEKNGDLDAAWKWHLANLQTGRHIETLRLNVCHVCGTLLRATACQGISHWSQSPMLSEGQLRQAQREIQSETAKRALPSVFRKGEYLIAKNDMHSEDVVDFILPDWVNGNVGHPNLWSIKRLGLWMIGQPELTLQLHRQLITNQLPKIDLPYYRRGRTVPCTMAVIFEANSKTPNSWGQLPPEMLAVAWKRSIPLIHDSGFYRFALPHDVSFREDDARLVALNVLLAAQRFRRVHDDYPHSIAELVPDYLPEVPLDPMSSIAIPVQYRRQSQDESRVWSVGCNEVDNGGEFVKEDGYDKDVGYRIRYAKPSVATYSEQ